MPTGRAAERNGDRAMLRDFHTVIRPTRKEYAFREDSFLVWCGSAVRDDDGYYYLF